MKTKLLLIASIVLSSEVLLKNNKNG